MARMHTRRRGKSGSTHPVYAEPPTWSTIDPNTIEEKIIELSNSGLNPSEIGLTLRDEGISGIPIPRVKIATGKKITKILLDNDAAPDLPEDLTNLMAKAIRLHQHLQENKKDYQNKRSLHNTEAKIRRLVNYYRGNKLDSDFTYNYDTARKLLE
jgi:small subunit ribosomal protein S15